MNKNTKQRNELNRKAGNYFHGRPCETSSSITGKKPKRYDLISKGK